MIRINDQVLIRDKAGQEVTCIVTGVSGREISVSPPVDGRTTFNVSETVSNLGRAAPAAAPPED